MKEILVKEYNNLIKTPTEPLELKNKIYVNFVNGAKVQVNGKVDKKYKVDFIDQLSNKTIYETEITNNMWSKTNKTYFIDYLVKVTDLDTGEVTKHVLMPRIKEFIYIFLQKL